MKQDEADRLAAKMDLPEPDVGFDNDYYDGLTRYETPVPRFCEYQYYTESKVREAISDALVKLTQHEPIAKVCHDLEGHIGWNPKITELPDEGTDLYTQPAQPAREWVGLTDFDIASAMTGQHKVGLSFTALCNIARAIEAKLREKNDGQAGEN